MKIHKGRTRTPCGVNRYVCIIDYLLNCRMWIPASNAYLLRKQHDWASHRARRNNQHGSSHRSLGRVCMLPRGQTARQDARAFPTRQKGGITRGRPRAHLAKKFVLENMSNQLRPPASFSPVLVLLKKLSYKLHNREFK